MTNYKTLDVSKDDRGVVTLILNRPEKRNALSAEMISELTDFANNEGDDPTTRAVVLSGHGSLFCAGGDLAWMHDQIQADRPTRMAEARKLAMMLYALNTQSAPLIGRIHGGAYGGAVGLAAVCDVAVAETATTFALTETRLGLIPATIGPYVVARLGEANARRVFMSARRFSADEAVRLGLIASHCTADILDAAVEREVTPYLSVAPRAVAEAKKLTRDLGPRIDSDVINQTITRLADIWETDEAAEGIAAFLEKRKPRWVS